MADQADTNPEQENEAPPYVVQTLVSALYDTSRMIAERLRPIADVNTKTWRTALKSATGHLGDQFNCIIQACDADDWGKMATLSTCVFEEFAMPPSVWEWETFQGLGKYKAAKIAALCSRYCDADDDKYCRCPNCDDDCEYDSELEEDEAQARESLSNVYVPPVSYPNLNTGSDEPEVL